MTSSCTPISLDQVADQLERLLLCYDELRRTNSLLQSQLQDITQERDSLKSRLLTARERIDNLLTRIPKTETVAVAAAAISTVPVTFASNIHDHTDTVVTSEQKAS